MTDIRSMYEKTYLGSWDIPEDRDAVCVIERVEAGVINNGTKADKKPLVYVRSAKGPLGKPIVLNATNMKTIAALYGYKVEAWIGKPIALFKATVQGVGGGQVEAIRIRPTAPVLPKASKDGDA